jgi:hypothetical protein
MKQTDLPADGRATSPQGSAGGNSATAAEMVRRFGCWSIIRSGMAVARGRRPVFAEEKGAPVSFAHLRFAFYTYCV